MPMNPEIKAQWVADLRSGQFEQGTGYLNRDGKFCCLGVLCEQAVKAGIIEKDNNDQSGYSVHYDGNPDTLSRKVAEWAGLPTEGRNIDNPEVKAAGEDGEVHGASLAGLNDGENGWTARTFDEIADLIENQL